MRKVEVRRGETVIDMIGNIVKNNTAFIRWVVSLLNYFRYLKSIDVVAAVYRR